jgi:hypothetical protein
MLRQAGGALLVAGPADIPAVLHRCCACHHGSGVWGPGLPQQGLPRGDLLAGRQLVRRVGGLLFRVSAHKVMVGLLGRRATQRLW